jgi:hypothetical protein
VLAFHAKRQPEIPGHKSGVVATSVAKATSPHMHQDPDFAIRANSACSGSTQHVA